MARSKDSRKVGKFQKNDRVLLQDEKMGKFSHRATVIDPRDRKSDDPRSYYIKKYISGEILLRNRRHFKKLPEKASETTDTHPAPQSEAPVEPRTQSEHARADRESLQADTAREGPHHVQRLTAGAWRIAREQREQHVHHQPSVLTAQGWEQYRPPDAIASLQCRSRRGTKWSN